MKFFKKINIGLILAIITIISVVIYCINVESDRKKSKEDIKKVCEEFVGVTNRLCLLPEQYQVIGEDGSKTDLNNYFSNMKNEIQNYTATEQIANIQKIILSEVVQNQLLNTATITTDFDRKITKISSYNFDGNQVTVTFKSKITIKQKYNDMNIETGKTEEKVKEESFDVDEETITLEHKDGKWKIVSANLDYRTNSSYNMNMNSINMMF